MYSTNGILLKTTVSGEADELASFFTEDFGKITLKVRGTKKTKTKQGNFIHMPSIARFSFVAGKNGYIMSGIADEKHYSKLASDLLAQAYVFSFFHLCDKVLYNEEKDPALWNLLKNILDEAEHSAGLVDEEKRLLLWKQEKAWLVSLLDVLGLKPAELRLQEAKTRKDLDKYVQNLLQQAFETKIEFFGLRAPRSA